MHEARAITHTPSLHNLQPLIIVQSIKVIQFCKRRAVLDTGSEARRYYKIIMLYNLYIRDAVKRRARVDIRSADSFGLKYQTYYYGNKVQSTNSNNIKATLV